MGYGLSKNRGRKDMAVADVPRGQWKRQCLWLKSWDLGWGNSYG